MEIIIDEFHYPTHRSFLAKLRNIFKYLKKKSYIVVILLLFYVLFRRFHEKFPINWFQTILGKKLISPIKARKIKENEELIKKLEVLDSILLETTENDKLSEILHLYHKEIFEMFNLEQLRENLIQSSHLIDQRIALFDSYKLELFSFSCLWFITKHILELLLHIKDILHMKYLEKFKRKYHNIISEVDKMTDYIVNEFYDSLLHAGFKNLMAHIKKTLYPLLFQYKSGINYEFSDILGLLGQIEDKMLTLNTKDLNLPDDNKRWSCYCLSSFNKNSQKKITFTDFNMVSTEISEIEDEDQETQPGKPTTEPAILFPLKQGLSVPKNTLDILSIFIGDISNHKYFIDQDCIQRYIIMADRDARAERYRCQLEEIREETEFDEKSSEIYSDQKDSRSSESHQDDDDNGYVSRDEIDEFQGERSPCSNEDQEDLGQTIEEARYYFALILKLFCGEIVDFLESSNLNIYIFYALKYEFFQLENRLYEREEKRSLEGWLNEIFNETLDGKERQVNFKDINQGKQAKIESLLKESRNEIYKSLFLSANEITEIRNSKNLGKQEREEKKTSAKILDYLMNYGASK